MAFDAFLKIDSIPGEATDQKHKEWISLLSYSQSLSQSASGTRSDAGAASAGRVDHGPFMVTKYLDKASPKLAAACCTGTHISEVRIVLNRATKEKQKFLEIVLNDVLVSSYSPSGTPTSDSTLPTETVGFSYGQIQWTYTQTNNATGAPMGDTSAKWSLTTNSGG